MKYHKQIFIFLTVILVLSSSVYFLREPLLDYAIGKVKEKVNERYGAELLVGDAGFLGFRDIYLKDVVLIPPGGSDTLFLMKSLKARVRIGKLLRMKIGFRELIVDSTQLNLIKVDNRDNYSFLFKKQNLETENKLDSKNIGFNERFSSLFNRINDLFNEEITIRQFKINYHSDKGDEMVSIPQLFFDGSVFKSSVITSSLEGVNLWLVNGRANQAKGSYDFSVKRIRGNVFALPFVDLYDGIKICFDSAQVKFDADATADIIPVEGEFKVHNLLVNHWRISPDDVLMPHLDLHLKGNIAEDSINAENGTHFTLNRLPLNITATYIRSPDKRLILDAGFDIPTAQDLFSSLPEGMFKTLRGFKADGALVYSLHFDLPWKNPDQLLFDSELKKKNFHIREYGSENFSQMNSSFYYLAMDKERPVRNFVVGPENPMFTPSDRIPDNLKNAVLTAEDPSFFNHSGFVEESFRESIATNLKEGRFARGGSTISMQLVKNVHLSRNKTISRKLEEALIVWLIEQNRLVSKERMFEVYLNIIEWGPDVYGIGEASRFYFGKLPKELTLAESIYLSSLIPHPKFFRYSFDAAGNLKPFMTNYFKLVAGRLVKREKISQLEADSLQPIVHLTGQALQIVLPPDTIPVDSLEFEQLQIQ